MDVQFVDWGTLLALLGLLVSVVVPAVGLLWRAIASQMKSLNRRFDKQDQDMAELKSDMAVVKNDLSYLKPRSERMEAAIVQIVRDVGRLEGRQQSSSPKEKVGAGGS
ncbi:MAG: hypothetical protein F4X74_04695 [Acidimicrobiia bacterium]|nr:hypothetical protein [Acidimicrobiia bacterium]